MQICRYIFLIIAVFCLFITVNAQIKVQVNFGAVPNLLYQLDCVSDLPVECSRENLKEQWKREFLKTNQDAEMLREWARLREIYSENIKLSKDNSRLNLFDKVRIVGFQAKSIEDYAKRLDLLTSPSDRRSFERIVRHFYPRFNAWWQREASKSGGAFARQSDELLRSPKIFGQIKQFYDFYTPLLPADYEISFNLFYVPDFVKEPGGGQQLENYSLMEFKPREKPEQRIDVAVHELNHFFFESMSEEDKARLAQSFYETNSAAIPAYNLLNETLATAFGNGMIARSVTPKQEFEKYVATRQSFYNNEAIDRASKAALPWLDKWLKNKKTINDPQFAREYISVLEKAFGDDLTTPKRNLSELFLFVDADFNSDGTLRRGARKALEAASFFIAEGTLSEENLTDFKSNKRLNSLFIIHPDNIKELAALKIISETEAQQIQKELEAEQQVLYNKERAPFTYIYIVAAKDTERANRLVEKLANVKQFQGIYK